MVCMPQEAIKYSILYFVFYGELIFMACGGWAFQVAMRTTSITAMFTNKRNETFYNAYKRIWEMLGSVTLSRKMDNAIKATFIAVFYKCRRSVTNNANQMQDARAEVPTNLANPYGQNIATHQPAHPHISPLYGNATHTVS